MFKIAPCILRLKGKNKKPIHINGGGSDGGGNIVCSKNDGEYDTVRVACLLCSSQ